MKFEIVKEQNCNLLNIGDLSILLEFNKKQSSDEYRIRTELLPEPFIGNPETAKVILLALNPGFKGGEYGEDFWHKDIQFKKLIIDNIELKSVEYPYYYLNEDKRFANSPGHIWCKRIFKEFINEIGSKSLSTKICCIQFHGYHSKKYKYLGKILPSQEQSISIIKTVMDKETPIVIMRSRNKWFDAIEELRNYEKLIQLNNPRNPTLSRGNMDKNNFKKIIDALS